MTNIKINVDIIYPIGSIYMSVNSTNPSTLFGGTWAQLEDRFLLGAGSTYKAGATGGEASHTLTIAEMPNHQHDTIYSTYGGDLKTYTGTGGGHNDYDLGNGGDYFTNRDGNGANFVTNYVGGSESHNNMPPYLVVYMWKRTA